MKQQVQFFNCFSESLRVNFKGAPTSAYISNVILRNFDEKVGAYCKIKNINYTRYSNDITLSGAFNINETIIFIKDNLNSYGFKLNYKKTKVIYQNQSQKITGIVVNQKININRKYYKKIRQQVYYIKKFGIDSRLKNQNITNKEKYLNRLLGKINFCLQIKNTKELLNYKKIILDILHIN